MSGSTAYAARPPRQSPTRSNRGHIECLNEFHPKPNRFVLQFTRFRASSPTAHKTTTDALLAMLDAFNDAGIFILVDCPSSSPPVFSIVRSPNIRASPSHHGFFNFFGFGSSSNPKKTEPDRSEPFARVRFSVRRFCWTRPWFGFVLSSPWHGRNTKPVNFLVGTGNRNTFGQRNTIKGSKTPSIWTQRPFLESPHFQLDCASSGRQNVQGSKHAGGRRANICCMDSFTFPSHSVFVLSRFRHGSLTLCFVLSSRRMPYIRSPPDR
ncbi:hypothetical protein DEU56DRAFT_902826 [Suillus clintonianus]|uniref:uncharacterized protein n=1 Tax=Suillus clintonianus TaxID=1904413 RepID=UPI001B871ED5|nr:uncharacterized protein DEU56DRAFT_902826 [Suillus clintonianus]KAG2129769.1 hypothetical protein DEU56DRAFT_902826 [Suillus clintonianus]